MDTQTPLICFGNSNKTKPNRQLEKEMRCQNMSFWMRLQQLIKVQVTQSEQGQLNQDQRHMKEKKENFPQPGTDLLLGPDFHHDRFHWPVHDPRMLYNHLGHGG